MTSTTTTASGIPYDLTVNDPSNLLGTDRTLVLANFEAAINDWSGWIQSKGTLRIRMDVTGTTANGRFGGISGGSKYLAASSGHNIFEFSATYKMRTGLDADANVPDVIISVNAPFMRQYYWIDPSPSSRTLAVPAGKVDLVTVFAHELGHAFGMAGWLDLNSGAVPSNNGISQYDNLIYATSTLGEGKILFSGSKASAIYGKKVPVFFASQDNTSEQVIHNNATYLCNRSHTQNLFHYGYFMSSVPEYDSTFFGLMAGVWVNRSAVQGIRIRVGALDAAIMGDLGIPMKSSLASTALP